MALTLSVGDGGKGRKEMVVERAGDETREDAFGDAGESAPEATRVTNAFSLSTPAESHRSRVGTVAACLSTSSSEHTTIRPRLIPRLRSICRC